MARWRRPIERSVPDRLVNFSYDDWKGTGAERFRAWRAARHAYFAEHGEPVYAFGAPWNKWGDFLDMLNWEGDVRRQVSAAGYDLTEVRPAQHWVLSGAEARARLRDALG